MFVDLKNQKIQIDDSLIEYELCETLNIINIIKPNQKILNYLFLVAYYQNKKFIENKTTIDLANFGFEQQMLNLDNYSLKRIVKIGSNKTGKNNNICDVPGVLVGQTEIKGNEYNTGLTVVMPHPGNLFTEKVVASIYVFNGFGKTCGLMQVDEVGSIETPIVFTSTLSVGKIADALNTHMLAINPNVTSINPIVMECNDGQLSKSRERILSYEHLEKAFDNLSTTFKMGDFGAGTGMICHGFKGGIGSSSRVIELNGKSYTIGILLNSNFGSANGEELIFKGRPLGHLIEQMSEHYYDRGSIVAAVACDIPLNERQLKRVLKRIELGISRTGSFGGHSSGDLFVGFTTQNKITKPFNENIKRFSDEDLNVIFKQVVEMTEEAVLNSMLYAHDMNGYKKEVKGLLSNISLFDDLLDIEIVKNNE